MYPAIDQHKFNLVIELLQDLNPRVNYEVEPGRYTIDQFKYSEAYLDGLMQKLKLFQLSLTHLLSQNLTLMLLLIA